MMRSPLFYPMNRGMDADAGGAAELQTDVMRFMAIISLCLVAIFALVQSIPLTPEQEPDSAPPAPQKIDAKPAADGPARAPATKSVLLTRPEPRKIKPRKMPPVLQRAVPTPNANEPPPIAQSTTTPATNTHSAAVNPPSKEQRGFTLRFESDSALTRLVARNVVGLYAIRQNKVQRMNIESGSIGFWPASSPGKIHEMDVSTVPPSVLSAWRRNNEKPAAEVKWGVSIPPSMSRQLNQLLANQSGGSLVISADGALRLEQ